MKTTPPLFIIILFIVLFTESAFSQFPPPIVISHGWHNGNSMQNPSIIYMGDQNDDGYDDFIIIQKADSSGAAKSKILFYYGNNPVNTSPSIIFPGFIPGAGMITACDVNRDGYRDIVTQRYQTNWPPVIDIYFGGPNLDTIVDYSFTYHDSNTTWLNFKGQSWPIDFNGDGWEDFVFEDRFKINSNSSFRYVFCETNTVMTTRDYKIIKEDTTRAYLHTESISFADLDGDGKDEVLYILYRQNAPATEPQYKVRIIYGNEDYDFSNYYEFTSDEYTNDVGSLYIIEDLQGDGRGEIVMIRRSGDPWPAWYGITLSYGTRPPNLIPNFGLNTQYTVWEMGRVVGDVNGDGYNDFLRSFGYETMGLFLGGNPMPNETQYKWSGMNAQSLNFGGRVGDVNGDGIDDFVVGENGYTASFYTRPKSNVYLILGSRSVVSTKEEKPEDEKSEIEIEIHPNPADEQVNIEYSIPYPGTIKRVIVDITGKELIKEEKRLEAGEYKEIIEIKRIGLPSGVYLYNIELNGEGKRTAKTVKFQVIK